MPRSLCKSCYNNLQVANEFIETFKKSQETLLNAINQHEANNSCNETITSVIIEKETPSLQWSDEEGNNESFTTACKEIDEMSDFCDSDDQNYLIEQSVKLSQQYKINKMNDESYTSSDSDDNNPRDSQADRYEEPIGERNLTSKTTNSPIITCPVCSKTFKRFALFSSHMQKHNQEITCKLCSMQFSDTDLYLKHFQTNHRYWCNICEIAFLKGNKYSAHMKAHSNGLPTFQCPVVNCSKIFTVKQLLKNHYARIHSEGMNFLCTLCGSSFKSSDNLNYHMKKHRGPSHLCTYCGKVYMQSIHLKYHMWRHTGVKPYKCGRCHKGFMSKRLLTGHLNRNCVDGNRRQSNNR